MDSLEASGSGHVSPMHPKTQRQQGSEDQPKGSFHDVPPIEVAIQLGKEEPSRNHSGCQA